MNQNVGALLRERKRKYFARGIAFAVASGICYGLYTGFLTAWGNPRSMGRVVRGL